MDLMHSTDEDNLVRTAIKHAMRGQIEGSRRQLVTFMSLET